MHVNNAKEIHQQCNQSVPLLKGGNQVSHRFFYKVKKKRKEKSEKRHEGQRIDDNPVIITRLSV